VGRKKKKMNCEEGGGGFDLLRREK